MEQAIIDQVAEQAAAKVRASRSVFVLRSQDNGIVGSKGHDIVSLKLGTPITDAIMPFNPHVYRREGSIDAPHVVELTSVSGWGKWCAAYHDFEVAGKKLNASLKEQVVVRDISPRRYFVKAGEDLCMVMRKLDSIQNLRAEMVAKAGARDEAFWMLQLKDASLLVDIPQSIANLAFGVMAIHMPGCARLAIHVMTADTAKKRKGSQDERSTPKRKVKTEAAQ